MRRYAGPSGSDEALGVAVDPSGTSYVTGESNGTSGKPRAVTIKYSSAGSLRWRRGFTGIVAGTQANAIAVSRVPGKAGVIIAGSMWNGMSEGGDILFVKYGATSGATKWWRTIGNGEAFDESAQEVAIDPHGGAVAVGATHDENHGFTHGFIAGIPAAGADGWGHEYWSGAGGTDFAVKYLFRFVGPGDWDKVLDGTAHGDDICRAVVVSPAGAYAAGETANAGRARTHCWSSSSRGPPARSSTAASTAPAARRSASPSVRYPGAGTAARPPAAQHRSRCGAGAGACARASSAARRSR